MKRAQRLRSAADFGRVRPHGARGWTHPLLVLYVAPRAAPDAPSRVGITVSGRVGNAVVRNRIRRRVRAALDARLPRLRSAHDLVIVVRPSARTATWLELNQALDTVLGRARLWQVAQA